MEKIAPGCSTEEIGRAAVSDVPAGGSDLPLRRGRAWIREACVGLLFLLMALWCTDPWIRHPATRMIGATDRRTHELNTDSMLPVTLAGWLDFAAFELGVWPLKDSRHLMFPRGASHGDSFDGLLLAIVTAALAVALPLPLAHSIAIVLGFAMAGWTVWLLGKRLWGPGSTALVLALAAIMMPYLFQRYATHANLFFVWVIPAAMLAFERWRENPDWRGTLYWALSFPLLGLSSWHTMISGMIFQCCASGAAIAHKIGADPAMRRRHMLTLLVAWIAGAALTVLVASPMLEHFERRRKVPESHLVHYSAPLAQYLMPHRPSFAGQLEFFSSRQKGMRTSWEAQLSIPLLLTALALAWMASRGRSVTKTALILTAVAGVIMTLGPRLQIAQAAASAGDDLPAMPLHYLLQTSRIFSVVHIPSRAVSVVFFAILVSAGFALQWIRGALARRHKPFLWWPVLAGVLVFCYWWSVPTGNRPTAPWPEVPKFYEDLGRRPGKGAVFDVPLSTYWFPHYNYYQLWHHRPEVSSVLYHDAVSTRSLDFVRGRREMAFFLGNRRVNPKTVDEIARVGFLDKLRRKKIDYVVVHPRFLNFLIQASHAAPENQTAFDRIEAAWKPRLVFSDSRIRAYSTRPLQPAPAESSTTATTRQPPPPA